MRRSLILFVVTLTTSLPSFGAIRVVNMGSDFKEFLRTSQDTSPENRQKAWDKFESKYQAIYDTAVFNKENDPHWREKRQIKLKAFFEALPNIQDRMIQLFDTATPLVEHYAAQFKSTFPDLPDGVAVFVMPSLFSFNGRVTPLKGEAYAPLFLGVDFITLRNDDLDVLFPHEFFHVYHFAQNLNAWATFATPLWFEGFATYVSGIMNPDRTDAALLMDADLADKCQQRQYIQEWAKSYRAILSSSMDSPEATDTYLEWFKINGPIDPKRRGYCLGLELFRHLSKMNSPAEMAKWNEDQFSQASDAALLEMSTN